jgi:hypothetical protein
MLSHFRTAYPAKMLIRRTWNVNIPKSPLILFPSDQPRGVHHRVPSRCQEHVQAKSILIGLRALIHRVALLMHGQDPDTSGLRSKMALFD